MRKMKISVFTMCINCPRGDLMKTNPIYKSKTTNHNIKIALQFVLIQLSLRKNTRRRLELSNLAIFSIIIVRSQFYLMPLRSRHP